MTALARTPDGRLLRLEGPGTAGVPAGSVVWTNPEMWAQNIRPEMWFPYLQTSRPDLCDLSDVRTYQQAWRLEHVWPALLAIAEAPEGRSLDPEPSQDGDDEMAKAKKSKVRARKPKTVKATNGDAGPRLTARTYKLKGSLPEDLGKGQEAVLLGLFKAAEGKTLARADLLAQAEKALPPGKQPSLRVVSFYLTRWKKDGRLEVS